MYSVANSTRYRKASRADRYGRGLGTGTGNDTSANASSASTACSSGQPAAVSAASTDCLDSPRDSAAWTNCSSSRVATPMALQPHQLDAAVLRAPLLGVVAGHRLVLAEALRLQPSRIHAQADKRTEHAARACGREFLVLRGIAGVGGMAIH